MHCSESEKRIWLLLLEMMNGGSETTGNVTNTKKLTQLCYLLLHASFWVDIYSHFNTHGTGCFLEDGVQINSLSLPFPGTSGHCLLSSPTVGAVIYFHSFVDFLVRQDISTTVSQGDWGGVWGGGWNRLEILTAGFLFIL